MPAEQSRPRQKADRRPAETVAKPKRGQSERAEDQISAREVLERMITAYRKASSYADAGTVHLLAEADGQKIIDQTANFSVTLVRPNKLRLQAYQVMFVCDGQEIHAAIDDHSEPGVGQAGAGQDRHEGRFAPIRTWPWRSTQASPARCRN